jgi:hypothetical protein
MEESDGVEKEGATKPHSKDSKKTVIDQPPAFVLKLQSKFKFTSLLSQAHLQISI